MNTKDEQTKLLAEIDNNSCASDFTLCLFSAALTTYKVDKCLRPFPPSPGSGTTEKDYDTVRETFRKIPPVAKIPTTKLSDPHIVLLLHWLLTNDNYPRLHLDPNYYRNGGPTTPQYVFRVTYPPKMQEKWAKLVENKSTRTGYHGSGVENFYSILKVGLVQQQQLEEKNSNLFGNGIYLSSDVTMAALYAPFGHTWSQSNLGDEHSVIAVCEMIDDCDMVKFNDGNVPEKYFLVTDCDYVRLLYLLVYCRGAKNHRLSTRAARNYFAKRPFFVLLVLYVLLLAYLSAKNYCRGHKSGIDDYFEEF